MNSSYYQEHLLQNLMEGEERLKNTRRLPEKNNVTLILFQFKKKKVIQLLVSVKNIFSNFL